VDAAEIGRALSPILISARRTPDSTSRPYREGRVRCVRIPIRWEAAPRVILVAASCARLSRPRGSTGPEREHQPRGAMLARNFAEVSLRESESRSHGVAGCRKDRVLAADAASGRATRRPSASSAYGGRDEGRTPRDPLWAGGPTRTARLPERDISRTDHAAHGSPLLQRRDGPAEEGWAAAWISINTEPLFHEGDPRLNGMVASFAEISERKRTEEAFARQRAPLGTA